jgi:hypothetical protein
MPGIAEQIQHRRFWVIDWGHQTYCSPTSSNSIRESTGHPILCVLTVFQAGRVLRAYTDVSTLQPHNFKLELGCLSFGHILGNKSLHLWLDAEPPAANSAEIWPCLATAQFWTIMNLP